MKLRRRLLWLIFLLAGCSGGAVVFAPTPLPPDLSPLRYDHPSGGFSAMIPRHWSAQAQNTTTLAAAAFALPGQDEPALRLAVVNLGERMDSAAFGALIDRYQAEIRPDAARYTEISRQAMGDGSWRLTGLRHSGGLVQTVNTFIEQSGAVIGLIEVLLPPEPDLQADLQAMINTFRINDTANLQPSVPETLALATVDGLEIAHVSAWSTVSGVFFITGEVANYGTTWVAGVPARAVLKTADGLAVVEAVDQVMGYGIPPGGFAPFSLRFGGGQPALTIAYELMLGGESWQPETASAALGPDDLTWTDESWISPDGRLTITGSVTAIGEQEVYDVRAVATIFDATGNVIAAAFTNVTPRLAPGQAPVAFQIIVSEMGGQPVNYIVNIQGKPM